MKPDRFAIGVVSRAHGVQGEVAVRVHEPGSPVLTRAPRCFVGGHPYPVAGVRRHGDREVLVRLRGVADRGAAQALRGQPVEVERSMFPALGEGEYYLADLMRLEAVDPSGAPVGRVAGLIETGGVPILSIQGRVEVLVPLTSPFVRRVDVSAGIIEVEPPDAGGED